jgi:hypothetical protein
MIAFPVPTGFTAEEDGSGTSWLVYSSTSLGERNFLSLYEFEPRSLDRPANAIITIPTELPRLLKATKIQVLQKELYKLESLYELIQRICTVF